MHVSRALAMFATISLIGVACSDNNTTGIPAGLEVYTASLSGANERLTPVTTTAKGSAIVTVLGNQLSWKVDITAAIDSITAGHLHHAPIDSAGPVRVNFNVTATGAAFTGTATQGSVTLTGDSVQTWLRQGNAYVNIHTKANLGGEIRGQLVKQ
ncbi:MAG TPA: CHRD domain-containing protein [Gemmatimonadales bacterium]|nr:CHRD domain-containing protein [Gemmatimonadales bacterium]